MEHQRIDKIFVQGLTWYMMLVFTWRLTANYFSHIFCFVCLRTFWPFLFTPFFYYVLANIDSQNGPFVHFQFSLLNSLIFCQIVKPSGKRFNRGIAMGSGRNASSGMQWVVVGLTLLIGITTWWQFILYRFVKLNAGIQIVSLFTLYPNPLPISH